MDLKSKLTNVSVTYDFIKKLVTSEYTKSVLKVSWTLLELATEYKNAVIQISFSELCKLSNVNQSKIKEVLNRMVTMGLIIFHGEYVKGEGINIEVTGCPKHGSVNEYIELGLPGDKSTLMRQQVKYIKIPYIYFTEEFFELSSSEQKLALYLLQFTYDMSKDNERTFKRGKLLDILKKHETGLKNASRLQNSINKVSEFLGLDFVKSEVINKKNNKKKVKYIFTLGKFIAGSNDVEKCGEPDTNIRKSTIFEYIKIQLSKRCGYTPVADVQEERNSWIHLYYQCGSIRFNTVANELFGRKMDNPIAYFTRVAQEYEYISRKAA